MVSVRIHFVSVWIQRFPNVPAGCFYKEEDGSPPTNCGDDKKRESEGMTYQGTLSTALVAHRRVDVTVAKDDR